MCQEELQLLLAVIPVLFVNCSKVKYRVAELRSSQHGSEASNTEKTKSRLQGSTVQ